MTSNIKRALEEPKALHDLKNHLAVIQGFCTLLLEETATDDPRRADLEEIHQAALSATKVLADAFTRPEGHLGRTNPDG